MPRSVRNVLLTFLTTSLGLLLLPTSGVPGVFRPTARAAASFNVNSLGDGADSDLNDGLCKDGSGQCTLRAAIQQANQLSGSDSISVTVAGIINLTSALPELTSVMLSGPGAAQLTVRRDPGAATDFRIFTIVPFSTVVISGLTVTGGRTTQDDGGGIYVSQSSSLALTDVAVNGNAALSPFSTVLGRGGGIFHDGSTLTMTNCTVSNNSASDGSTSGSTSGRDGGGLYIAHGNVNISNSTISGNRAGNPADGTNGTPGWGGGIYIGTTSSNELVTLTNTTVSGNRAGGPGLGFFPFGGGIYNNGWSLTLNGCTVVGNVAGSATVGRGGGISAGVFNNFGSIFLRNTIVADNTAALNADLDGRFTSQDFNLIRNPGTATISGPTAHNVTGAAPLLSPLQNNGGLTLTHALLAGSPAIDAGSSGGLTTDQRGLTRPFDNPAAANAADGADIGAFEAQASPAAGQIQFSAGTYTAAESAGTAAITVTRTGGSVGAVSVTFATADGTATAGADYTAAANVAVTFADGDTAPKTIQVPVTDDLLDEGDETVNLTLSNPTGGAALVGSPATATLFIGDNDVPPPPSLSVSDVTVPEGDAGRTPANFVLSLSGPSNRPVMVFYTTAEGTAKSNGEDFENAFSGLIFAPGETSKTVTVPVRGDAFVEPDETFFLDLSFPTNATIADARGVGTIVNDDSPTTKSVQFSDYQFGTRESFESLATRITLYRTGDLSAEASVEYSTSDGTATDRGDYAPAYGRVTFPAGADLASFDVFVTDDRFREGQETFNLTLSNPSGVTLGAGSTTTVIINDNDPVNATSPVTLGPSFDPFFFVWQHYRDFLNREPDGSGLTFWTNQIIFCGGDAQCREVRRINVSAAFFVSIEFQQTGYLAYRARKAAFGNFGGKPVPLTREELFRDVSILGAGLVVNADGWEQKLEQNKQAYFAQLAASSRFAALYPQTLTPEQFIDALNANAGGALSPAERDALVAELKNGARTRAQALRVVAEDADLSRAEFNKAFVLMQYFGYLRRDPDAAPDGNFDGYNFWLGKLNEFNGNYIRAEMVKAFIDSTEYRNRFGL